MIIWQFNGPARLQNLKSYWQWVCEKILSILHLLAMISSCVSTCSCFSSISAAHVVSYAFECCVRLSQLSLPQGNDSMI